MNDFQLHPRLSQDCLLVGHLPLSLVLMMNDQQYPWFILVPQRSGLLEIHQLTQDERIQLMDESCLLAEAITALYQPDKLNIAAIGNLVPQLHIHHVARYRDDAAWPAPIWGKAPPVAYADKLAEQRLQQMREQLANVSTLSI